jgi:hypothetical protein
MLLNHSQCNCTSLFCIYRQVLGHYATSQKVTGSDLNEVIGFFN